MFVGKAGSLPEKYSTKACSGLTRKHDSRLERLARDKHCSLVGRFASCKRKKGLLDAAPKGDRIVFDETED
jgi:hypothetical protein